MAGGAAPALNSVLVAAAYATGENMGSPLLLIPLLLAFAPTFKAVADGYAFIQQEQLPASDGAAAAVSKSLQGLRSGAH